MSSNPACAFHRLVLEVNHGAHRGDSLGGNLGSDVLRRFNTTFDYSRERMILEPNQSFDEPFRFDRSGMRLALGKEIKVGDSLTHVNGKAVSAGDYGGIRETLMGSGEVGLTLRQLI